MKKQYTCNCCNTQTNYARVINSGHLLCNPCNLQLLKDEELRLNDTVVLRVVEQRGDFKIVKAFNDPIKTKQQRNEDFWENRRRVRELVEMDNCSMVGWDCHESY